MAKGNPRYSREFKERAVRLVLDSQTDYETEAQARRVIALQLGCSSESLRNWLRDAEARSEPPAAAVSDERERIRQLEREVRDLRRSNEILRLASAFFAQAELDRLKS